MKALTLISTLLAASAMAMAQSTGGGMACGCTAAVGIPASYCVFCPITVTTVCNMDLGTVCLDPTCFKSGSFCLHGDGSCDDSNLGTGAWRYTGGNAHGTKGAVFAVCGQAGWNYVAIIPPVVLSAKTGNGTVTINPAWTISVGTLDPTKPSLVTVSATANLNGALPPGHLSGQIVCLAAYI